MFAIEVKAILEEVKAVVGIDGEVEIEIKPYKTRGASIDLRRRALTINSHLLDLGEDVVKYLVLHELVHLKLQTRHHGAKFQALMRQYAKVLGIDLAECQHKIARRLLEVNGLVRQNAVAAGEKSGVLYQRFSIPSLFRSAISSGIISIVFPSIILFRPMKNGLPISTAMSYG